jgi:hypothetical protein
MKSRNSGLVRKIALMRVEHDGQCAFRLHGRPSTGLVPQPEGRSHDRHHSGRTGAVPRSRARDRGRGEAWWQRAVAAFPPTPSTSSAPTA